MDHLQLRQGLYCRDDGTGDKPRVGTVDENPAAKLLDFYEEARVEKPMTWEMARAERSSPTMQGLVCIQVGVDGEMDDGLVELSATETF